MFDNNGTSSTQIGKVFDNNGTTSTPIYTSEVMLYNAGSTSEYAGGWQSAVISGSSFDFTIGSKLEIKQVNYVASTSAKIYSKQKIAISGTSTLKFTYSATKAGNGTFTFAITPSTTEWDVYDTSTNLTKFTRISTSGSGTASVNVSGVSGSYYVRFSVFSSNGNSTLSVTKIWLE